MRNVTIDHVDFTTSDPLTQSLIWQSTQKKVKNGHAKDFANLQFNYPCDTILAEGSQFTITATETRGILPWEKTKDVAWEVIAIVDATQ